MHSRKGRQFGQRFTFGRSRKLAETVQRAEIYGHGENDTTGSEKMIGVVDTSALIRLFIPDGPIPEGFEKFLSGVERGNNMAIAPELLLVESANVLDRK